MKVINIASSYSSKYAGNFIPSLFALAKKLKENYQVIFSFPTSARNRFWVDYLLKNGFKVFFFINSSNKKMIKSLKRINKENGVSLFYSHFISTPIVKMLSPISHKLKLILHIHSDFRCGSNKLSFSSKIKRFVFDKCVRRDASYIYVSDVMKSEDNNCNSYYVRNALNVDRIISNEQKNKLDESIFSKEKIKFLTFGWSPETKGIDIVCDAFIRMKEEDRKKAILFIVVDENGEEKCINFVNKAINVDIEKYENIVLLEPQEDVFELYRQCDVFISSSRSEGFSYSILEALYFGLDVLASDIDGTRWAHNLGTKLFSIKDTNELTNLMRTSLALNRCPKVMQTDLAKLFSISTWVNEISSIIEGSF